MFDQYEFITCYSYLHITEKVLLGPPSEQNMCRMNGNDVKAAEFNFIRSSGSKP